jgi:UDP-N-acetylglucosamine--N-acetylmuramyl-(pentapeptide) pyrophosphoryl-undecaprenol N-acetylglucosamine transferase
MLADALTRQAGDAVDVDPIPVESSPSPWQRLWQCGQLWRRAARCFDEFEPNVVVGFGGWVSAPVVLAARQRHIRCLLHEQNVLLGRANRWLRPWVDRVAVSFPETRAMLHGTPSVTTGLPVREAIGQLPRATAAKRFGLDPDRPTLLVLGGSQGAQPLNRLMMEAAGKLSPEERRTWQVLHGAGARDEAAVRAAYRAHGLTAWVAPLVLEMAAAYAQADVVLARAGASTIAELARCGLPVVLIPYPHAGGHQRANAQVVEAAGGAVLLEEAEATPDRVLEVVRRLFADPRLRAAMGSQMHALYRPDAAQRLSEAIVEVAQLGCVNGPVPHAHGR